MRAKILLVFFLFTQSSFAQQDYNWCFGANAGINFSNPDSFQIFRSKAYNSEINASISDENGGLLFYVGYESSRFKLFNGKHEGVFGGDTLRVHGSMTNGLIILPLEDGFYSLFQIDDEFSATDCPNYSCVRLYYTLIKKEEGIDSLLVLSKNNLLLDGPLEEKMAAVKHANGKDWWLLLHDRRKDSTTPCTDKFYKLLVSANRIEIDSQNIGSMHCSSAPGSGEMIFSKDGTKLASAIFQERRVEIFNFDRCTGELFNYRLAEDGTNNIYPYGCEFSSSGHILYISETELSTNGHALYQYNLNASNIPASQATIRIETDFYVEYGQIQRAPNGQIILSNLYNNSSVFNLYNQNISVIEHPDSLGLACAFQRYSIYLGDSSRSSYGLPNMPNYNLGVLSIYQAEAGENQTLCSGDTTVKGVFIGSPSVPGVQYKWEPASGLDSLNEPRPFVIPEASTWYYATFTDTSIKYSCQSRIDSVFVEVKNCVVGIRELNEKNQISIYPNPVNELLFISSSNPQLNIHQIIISNLSGKRVLQTSQTPVKVSGFSKGLYFVRVEFTNGQSTVRKVVIQ